MEDQTHFVPENNANIEEMVFNVLPVMFPQHKPERKAGELAKSLSDVMSRIESIANKKGLETHFGPTGEACYITSEMFYVEIQAKRNGHVNFVKVAHHGETPQESEDLLQLLRAKDFETFGTNLEGLLKLYEVEGNSDIKAKVYYALQCLENELYADFNTERMSMNKNKLASVLLGRVGYITPRRGGIPMTTEFFVSPADLLEVLEPGTYATGSTGSITICGTRNEYRLSFLPKLDMSHPENNSASVCPTNRDLETLKLPACFFMTFSEPVVLIVPFIHKLQDITGLPLFASNKDEIHQILICKHFGSGRAEKVRKGLRFIKSLPDCADQCYYIYNSKPDPWTDGAQINRIGFTESRHVALILEFLRHQAAFNTLLCSCISSNVTTQDIPDMLFFEVSLLRDATFCITFQHPSGSNLCSVLVCVVTSKHLRCKTCVHKADPPLPCNDELLAKIIKRSMSIPITMRTIFKKAREFPGQDTTPTIKRSEEVPESNSSVFEQTQTLDGKPTFTKATKDEASLIPLHNMDNDLILASLYTEPSDSHNLVSNIEQETSFTFAQDDCSEMMQCESSTMHHSPVHVTEEQDSNVEALSPIMPTEQSHFTTEDLDPSEAQETSLVTTETNSSATVELSPSVVDQLNSSFPDELYSNFTSEVS
uniref:Mediator of RNA polymerase II transcription subunit 1 n=1 Tax=Leptobrachium leishanense TaxID=445787 RepID=A0A8C5MKT4_9ANUR